GAAPCRRNRQRPDDPGDAGAVRAHGSMNPSLLAKPDHLGEREEEINALLSEADVFEDQARYRNRTIELSEISPVVNLYQDYKEVSAESDEAREMLRDGDPEIRDLAEQELARLAARLERTESVHHTRRWS